MYTNHKDTITTNGVMFFLTFICRLNTIINNNNTHITSTPYLIKLGTLKKSISPNNNGGRAKTPKASHCGKERFLICKYLKRQFIFPRPPFHRYFFIPLHSILRTQTFYCVVIIIIKNGSSRFVFFL